MTIGNIRGRTCNSHSMHTNALIRLLPFSPKICVSKQTDKVFCNYSHYILPEVVHHIHSLLFCIAILQLKIDCGDGQSRLCHKIIGAWIADHKEMVMVAIGHKFQSRVPGNANGWRGEWLSWGNVRNFGAMGLEDFKELPWKKIEA